MTQKLVADCALGQWDDGPTGPNPLGSYTTWVAQSSRSYTLVLISDQVGHMVPQGLSTKLLDDVPELEKSNSGLVFFADFFVY